MKKKTGKPFWLLCLVACFIWWLGLFTDEYLIFVLPALLVAFLTWPWLRRVRWFLTAAYLLLLSVGVLVFILVLPNFITPDIREPMARMIVRSISSPGEVVLRNLKYLVLNTVDIFIYTFGWSTPHSLPQTILAAFSGLFLVLLTIFNRVWRGWGRMIIFWVIAVVSVGGILLPEGNDILHQVTYYNRPLVALMIVILGLFTWSIFKIGRRWISFSWLGILIVIAGLNYYTAATGVRNDPEEAYLTRYGVDEILQVHDRLRSGDLKAPVFIAYPRFRNVVNGVYDELEYLKWHTTDEGDPPWSLYRSIMPRLYLRHFEAGELRANPKQFARWVDVDEHIYRSAANHFYDMPAGIVWDLESIRSNIEVSGTEMEWIGMKGEVEKSRIAEDLLGAAPFSSLPEGTWSVSVPFSPEKKALSMVFAVRHSEPASFTVSGGVRTEEIECTYDWGWQLFAKELNPGLPSTNFQIRTEGEVEVIGPVLIPVAALAAIPPSLRKKVPPSGISLLDLRGMP